MRRSAFALLLLLPLPAMASAQSDSTASPPPAAVLQAVAPGIHAGQWGATFDIENQAYGIGALRFTSPTTAWTLNARLSAETNTNPDQTAAGAFFGIGRRTYGALHGRVRPYHEFGGGLGFSRGTQTFGTSKQTTTTYGLSIDGIVGGAVFVVPDLSVGAEWSLSAGYGHAHTSNNFSSSVSSSNYWSIDGGQLRLVGAFLF